MHGGSYQGEESAVRQYLDNLNTYGINIPVVDSSMVKLLNITLEPATDNGRFVIPGSLNVETIYNIIATTQFGIQRKADLDTIFNILQQLKLNVNFKKERMYTRSKTNEIEVKLRELKHGSNEYLILRFASTDTKEMRQSGTEFSPFRKSKVVSELGHENTLWILINKNNNLVHIYSVRYEGKKEGAQNYHIVPYSLILTIPPQFLI